MMRAGHGKVNEICFAAEGLSGTAAAASLRRLGHLMERAPSGRLFSAIATLSESSSRAGLALEAGGASLATANEQQARARLEEAMSHLTELSGLAGKPSNNRAGRSRRAAR